MLNLEQHNFRVPEINGIPPSKWEKEKSGLLVAPTGDVWSVNLPGEKEHGEQLFTWDAAIREAKRAGKRIPTDAEFSELFKTQADMPNLVFAGYRPTDGSFASRATYAYFWASSQLDGTTAWYRYLYSTAATVNRNPVSQQYGFSLRCLHDSLSLSPKIELYAKLDGEFYSSKEIEKKIEEIKNSRKADNNWIKLAKKALKLFNQ